MMTAVMDRLHTAPDRRPPTHGEGDRRFSAAPSGAQTRVRAAHRGGDARAASDARVVGVPRSSPRAASRPPRPSPDRAVTPAPSKAAPPMAAPPARALTGATAHPVGTRSPGRAIRRVVAGVLVGGLTMLGVATLDTFAGATVPVLGTIAALPEAAPRAAEVVEIEAPPSTPGTCLNWSRPDAADAAIVPCAKPHLFEQAGTVALADQPVLPDDRQWRQLVNERCTTVVETYLDGSYDPDGRYRVGALKPSPAKWEEGDRELRCGLQSASRSGALYPLSGRAADGDQSAVQEAGTCLAIDGRTIGDPVDCTGAHAVEAVGVVDMTEKFPEAFPLVADQDAFLQPECARIADEYAGGPEVIAAKKLTVYWDNLTEASWAAGTRKVNCNLAALLPDRSGFAPVTGSVRGEVLVGETPAPPSANAPAPGVPAPTVTPLPVAPTDGLPGAEPGTERPAEEQPVGGLPDETPPDEDNPLPSPPLDDLLNPLDPVLPLPGY